ncbi:glutathione S-transferase family protein [Ancylobacter sp. SL191]|uniref:glutathione S-transferase family protein n=1 Tax=Ancylobacter sp. SL191 TaxID=2995166 RepID=UPI00226F7825|nr:glutathione S-transferase family protein [Ancylobacter sp. SL191]WAC28562.1 glutathione S-transferase family protein [Ancylobacter sp. SL191]
MMAAPRLYGTSDSVYVRIARLALAEKGVAHELVPVDPFAPGGPPESYLRHHPFGRIPALEHEGFWLYETGAITRYVDDAFAGPSLQPTGARERARMNQIIGIADAYAYRPLVWGVYVERVEKPASGRVCDEPRLAAALVEAGTCLSAIAALMGEGPFLAGARLSLADLHLAPMIDYFRRAPEGAALMAAHPGLARWWERMAGRAQTPV